MDTFYCFEFLEEAKNQNVLVSTISTDLNDSIEFLSKPPYNLKIETLKHCKYGTYNRNFRVAEFLIKIRQDMSIASNFNNIY